MLSGFLKLVQRVIKDETNHAEFSPEVNATLSFIDSGFFPVSVDGKTTFIFKASEDEINSFQDTDHVRYEFECIKRPEFPSVRMNFELRNKSNETCRFDYFFNTESEEEVELLERLEHQGCFEIIFVDSKIEYSKKVEITKNDRDVIKNTLVEARS